MRAELHKLSDETVRQLVVSLASIGMRPFPSAIDAMRLIVDAAVTKAFTLGELHERIPDSGSVRDTNPGFPSRKPPKQIG
jgi:hypothetical protein